MDTDAKDIDNPEYTGKVLCSPGLGVGYVKRIGKRHEWNEGMNSINEYSIVDMQVSLYETNPAKFISNIPAAIS